MYSTAMRGEDDLSTAEVCHVKGLLLSQAEIVHLRGVVRQDGVTGSQRPSGSGSPRVSILWCRWPRGLRVLCAILSKWSLPTRLETRTKESNVHASMPAEKLTCAMKVSDAKRKQQHRPTMILNERFEYERVR